MSEALEEWQSSWGCDLYTQVSPGHPAGSVTGCCAGLALLAAVHIFHRCGNFVVRFLGTELGLMASGHQAGLGGRRLLGPADLTKCFPCAGMHLWSRMRDSQALGGYQFSLSVYTVRLFLSRIPEESSKGAFL